MGDGDGDDWGCGTEVWESALQVSRIRGVRNGASCSNEKDGEWKRARRKGLLSDEMALHH